MEELEAGLSILEVAVQSNANEIINYFLTKLVNDEEISTLENYVKNCCRPDAVQLFQECLLYRTIRLHDAERFHMSSKAKIFNEQRKLIKPSFLEIAAQFGSNAFIDALLKKSIYNEEEWTKAIETAIVKGHAGIAEAISDRKRLLRKRAENHFTWLHSAVCDNDPDMVTYILERHLVNPDFNNEVVGTALALSHMMCYEKCIDVLENFNVDVNRQNKYSQSPLHEAIASGMTDHCSYLISRANEIDKPGFMGYTGLQCAVMKGNEELCGELVKKGADCIRYVQILQQTSMNETVLPISKSENAVTLCMKIHKTIYPCFLEKTDSFNGFIDCLETVETDEILHLSLQHCNSKLLMFMFEKSTSAVQQLVIEDLLDHFALKDEYVYFVDLLKIEITNPKLFANGENLLTNLLKKKNLKYCSAIINSVTNKRWIVSANAINETPLQISIETDLFDFLNPLILNWDDESDVQFSWHDPLISLFKKLSISNNNDVDQKLLAAIKIIIYRGGYIYKETHGGAPIINYCTRYKEKIENFQNKEKSKERGDKKICSVCLDMEINCAFDCGHTVCMDCAEELYQCPICYSEVTKRTKLYFN